MFVFNRPQAEQEWDWKAVSLNWRLFDNAKSFLVSTAVKDTQKYKKERYLYPHIFATKIRMNILEHTHIIGPQFGVCTKHQDRQWSVAQPLAQNKPLSVGSSLSSLFPDLCHKWYVTRVGEGKVQIRGNCKIISFKAYSHNPTVHWVRSVNEQRRGKSTESPQGVAQIGGTHNLYIHLQWCST